MLSVDALAQKNIEHHSRLSAEHEWVKGFVSAEALRRAVPTSGTKTLEEFESGYFGPEVGPVRRYLEAQMHRYISPVDEFLDMGCGGVWWKESYWPIPKRVTGVEINPFALLSLRDTYWDHRRYRLIYAPYGLTELPDQSFDLALSSSVLGYVLPSIAQLHIAELARLTRRGGYAVFSRVKAANIWTHGSGTRLREISPGVFDYAYSQRDLRREIMSHGFVIEESRSVGLRLPLPWRAIQTLYRQGWAGFMDAAANRLFPIFPLHHLIVARKRGS